jgi:ATP-binding cassette, subfamily G (WHITE), member 2, SNQ2
VDAFGGYLENPGDTQDCRYCQYKAGIVSNLWCLKTTTLIYSAEQVGDEYIKPLNMVYDNRWKDAWVIFAFFGER